MIARPSPARSRLALGLLTLTYVFNFIDRQLIGIVGQSMKTELALTDRQLGMLGGLAFALFYTILGLPIARLAERRSRVGIIALSLGFWSAMTALCGIVRTFPALLLARMGVGVGEAGCAPPSQSLISDMYLPERRATALAIFSLGVPIGMLIGAVGGGWIAQELGWRTAFVVLGVPGLLLAAILGFVVPEPDRAAMADVTPPLGAVVRDLLADRAFLHMAAGASLASFAGYGLTNFSVPLLVRSYHLSLGQAASGFGLVVGVAVGIGIGCGGWISDRLSVRNPDAPAVIAALGTLVAAIVFQLALRQPSPVAVGVMAFLPLIGAHLYFGPTYGVTVNAVGPKSRATAIALLLMAMNAIGLGLGPLFVGTMSDVFAETCGGGAACSAHGLEQAMRLDLLVYLWATTHFTLAARAMRMPVARTFAH